MFLFNLNVTEIIPSLFQVIQSNGVDELEKDHVESILKATDRK